LRTGRTGALYTNRSLFSNKRMTLCQNFFNSFRRGGKVGLRRRKGGEKEK